MVYEPDKHKKSIICPTNTCEDICITVPVEVHAQADVGEIELKCTGCSVEIDPQKYTCDSKFKIVQKIHACIPVNCYVECKVNEEHVDFVLEGCNK